ncbi:MAG: 30S ribosomal protein S16 [Gemmatales bacterium]
MVTIRLRVQGRKHRHFFRMCAMDKRQPNDGRFIEELGLYDPHEKDNEKGVVLNAERIKYWLSVGAQPSHKAQVLINKYLKKFEEQAKTETISGHKPLKPNEATA